jgi:serine protease Do
VDTLSFFGTAPLADALGETASRLRAATVQVRARGIGGCGSGVIWHADGLIITNAHCVRGRSVGVELDDGRTFEARVVASDPGRDLASLAIPTGDLPAATPADPRRMRAGELVLAVGNPWGVTAAVSVGVLHSVGESRWVCADVRLAPGNSGGPLATVEGHVVGINTMIVNGFGVAVAAHAVPGRRRVRARGGDPGLDELVEGGDLTGAGVDEECGHGVAG